MSPPSVTSDRSVRPRAVRIRVDDASAPQALLATLHELAGVSFVNEGQHDAILCLDEGRSLSPALQTEAFMSLSCPKPPAPGGEARSDQADVLFADDPLAPWPFRGRRVVTTIPANSQPLMPLEGERVLASAAAGALWTVSVAEGCTRFRSALPLLDIVPDGSFAQIFSGSNFLSNLPLLHLLAQYSSNGMGTRHALRAQFMFDDPNLHWPSYGYVKYAALLASAEQENYHVSFATIPLDAWFTHAPTAALFREQRALLSLLVHGNNHTRHELARQSTPLGCTALLLQARRRIEWLERRAQVSVDRVMVPPHGACTAEMLAALPDAGFDGACLSAGSLIAHNPGADWIQSLGFRPAEWVHGCPVMPRWALVGIEESELLVAAYLGRPLILRGHHGDLREGLDILVHRARFINGLGPVQWADNASLLRSSYHLSISGTTAYLRPFANQVSLTLPSQVTTLMIEPAESGAAAQRHVITGLGAGDFRCLSSQPIPIDQGQDWGASISVTREAMQPPQAAAIRQPGLKASSVLRRLLTEARDRLMPLTT